MDQEPVVRPGIGPGSQLEAGAEMRHVLEGVRVLEVAEGIAGPVAGMMLAELGAEVIKVEPVEGDWSRTLGPPFIAGHAPAFLAVNYGKRSLPVDLGSESGRAVVTRLAARADVVLEGYRPGVAGNLGLDRRTLLSANPNLVYVDISGYGSAGPGATRPGSDTIIQGYSGLMSVTGQLGGEPCRVGTPIADTVAGVYGALAAVLGVLRRHRSGGGGGLSVSLLESLIAIQNVSFADHFASGEDPAPLGTRSSLFAAPAQAFETTDGYVMVSCHTPRQWKRLCSAINHPEWLDDPRFEDNHARVENIGELTAELSHALKKRTTSEWLKVFRDAGVNAGPINTYGEVLADEQVRATGIFRQVSSEEYGVLTYTRSAIAEADGQPANLPAPPLLGEGAREVLSEGGFSPDEVEELLTAGVVREIEEPAMQGEGE